MLFLRQVGRPNLNGAQPIILNFKFKYWLKRIEDSKSSPKNKTHWTSVTIIEATQTVDEALHVKVGQASIEVKVGFNSNLLTDVVRARK